MLIYPAVHIRTHSLFWFIRSARHFCSHDWELKTWTVVRFWTVNVIFHLVWGWSNKQGIGLSAVSTQCYWAVCFSSACLASAVSSLSPSLSLRPSFFPHRSPSLPLFHCCCCSWPCLQMSTRTEQLFSMGQAPHPSFIHSHTHTHATLAVMFECLMHS